MLPTSSRFSIECCLTACHAWCPAIVTHPAYLQYIQACGHAPDWLRCDPALNVNFVDPLLRRRLSAYAKAGLVCLHEILQRSPAPLVFASRHGDLVRTTELLKLLAVEQDISPTAFGLAVHNAVAGVAAIIEKNPEYAIAIGGGANTFWYGLLDAIARQRTHGGTVIYLYVDFPSPPEYQDYLPQAEIPIVCCLQLGSGIHSQSSQKYQLQLG